ncbi:MAG: pyruvate ferredoxin oxidoreductase [Candidatus Thermoplasmatota archaeon]|nr:pyruvate ferredoxin oxidoreductase [Candidatus Thermoplasmatota archaeon]
MILGIGGDEAVALAAKQCNVDVVAAYPITPQTIIVEKFSDYVANGETQAEYVRVESEHSAMSACVGASARGARTFTATASQGLLLMHEILYIASSMRLPIVMANVNRAISAPINIHADHADSMAVRDSGWIQLSCVDAQEAYDTTIMAFKIAEETLLPVMVLLDGFVISHTLQNVSTLSDEQVLNFIGSERKSENILDPEKPKTFGAMVLPDYYSEIKMQQIEAMDESKKIVENTFKEFGDLTGRRYPLVESYKTDDADNILLCMGSAFGTAKVAVDDMRAEGKKVGVSRVKCYRPFAGEEVREAIKNAKSVGVADRVAPFGSYPPLYLDTKASCDGINLKSFVYGLGGRDVNKDTIKEVFDRLEKGADAMFVGVRE